MQLKLGYLSLFLLLMITNIGSASGMYISTQKEEEKRFKINPNPQKHYRVTVTIEDAPGEFKNLYTYANYQTTNCQYRLKGFAGAVLQPYHRIPLHFKKLSETQYQGEFYADGMLDEDYNYGTGICHWQLNNVSIVFKATENEEDTRFSASVSARDLDQKQLETNHLKLDYPKEKKINNYLSTGELNKSLFEEKDYFTFYIEIEEI